MFESFWSKIKNDINFRIKLFLLLSIVLNFVYALFLFILSRVYFSKWFFVMSNYYALLSLARIFTYLQTNPKKHLRKKMLLMRACGGFLILLNFVVSVMTFLLIYTQEPVKHHDITVITLATYTFSSLTIAIISSVKNYKNSNYVYFFIKMISLISTSVSLVTLTNTMLSTFGEGNTLLRNIVLPSLSGAVAIFINMCAIFMIIKANLVLRTLENEKK